MAGAEEIGLAPMNQPQAAPANQLVAVMRNGW